MPASTSARDRQRQELSRVRAPRDLRGASSASPIRRRSVGGKERRLQDLLVERCDPQRRSRRRASGLRYRERTIGQVCHSRRHQHRGHSNAVPACNGRDLRRAGRPRGAPRSERGEDADAQSGRHARVATARRRPDLRGAHHAAPPEGAGRHRRAARDRRRVVPRRTGGSRRGDHERRARRDMPSTDPSPPTVVDASAKARLLRQAAESTPLWLVARGTSMGRTIPTGSSVLVAAVLDAASRAGVGVLRPIGRRRGAPLSASHGCRPRAAGRHVRHIRCTRPQTSSSSGESPRCGAGVEFVRLAGATRSSANANVSRACWSLRRRHGCANAATTAVIGQRHALVDPRGSGDRPRGGPERGLGGRPRSGRGDGGHVRAGLPASDPPSAGGPLRDRRRAARCRGPDDGPYEVRRERPGLVYVRSRLGVVARVTPDRIVVVGDAPDLGAAFRPVFSFALAHLLAARDRHVLHAATLAVDDGCVLVLGPTGAGKSTVALCALRCGWPVLGDDLVALDRSATAFLATAVPRPIAAPRRSRRRPSRVPFPGDTRGGSSCPPTPSRPARDPCSA